jgi:hypothetical protein
MEKGDYIFVSQTELKDLNEFNERDGGIPGWSVISDYNSLSGFYKIKSINDDNFSLNKIPGSTKAGAIPMDYHILKSKLPENKAQLFSMRDEEIIVQSKNDLEGKIKKINSKKHILHFFKIEVLK